MPAVPCIAPAIADAGRSDEEYFRWNDRINRNSGLVNFLDGCGVTLPCHQPGKAPVGFLVFGPAMSDRRVLAVAAAVEKTLSRN
jgi:aspartyl-tRNA(Asn)/glutamyl-tRNA(Gln) amidotransferase subunit A